MKSVFKKQQIILTKIKKIIYIKSAKLFIFCFFFFFVYISEIVFTFWYKNSQNIIFLCYHLFPYKLFYKKLKNKKKYKNCLSSTKQK